MHSVTKLARLAAIFAVAALFAHNATAQGAAAGSAASGGNVYYKDICVPEPNIKLGARIRPHKKFAHIQRTTPVTVRAHALASARHHRPKPVALAYSACPTGQKLMHVAYTEPLVTVTPTPAASLCESALGSSVSVTSSQVSAMLVAGGLSDPEYSQGGMVNIAAVHDPNELAAAVGNAVHANPDAGPAILAYALHGIDPNNKEATDEVVKAAYNAAPNQTAGLTYAAVLTNPGETLPITQAFLAAAPEGDSSIIRQCAVDANPNLANEIATAAFVPPLAGPFSSIGQNDIRNNVNNPSGSTTLVPGLPGREPDNSAV